MKQDSLYQQLTDTCPANRNCQNKLCQMEHRQKFQGICARFLLDQIEAYQNQTMDEGEYTFHFKKCQVQNCELRHLRLDLFESYLDQTPINGVYAFNLCSTQCGKPGCQYIHRDWAKGYCLGKMIKFLGQTCNQNCQLNHIKWEEVRKKAYMKFNKNDMSPESLCSKEHCDCNCHIKTLKNVCIYFLKGDCPYLQCNKSHIDWEDITSINFVKPTKYFPCSKVNQSQQEQITDSSGIINYEHFYVQECYLKKLKKEIKDSNKIDIIFIMDITRSMAPWKKEMENKIENIILQFQQSTKGYGIRIGFVGYRDYDDEDKIVFRCLTDQFGEITKFIKTQQTKGGGDIPEDIGAGLAQALKLNISKHPNSILCTFLICDAPNHGSQYHDLKKDNYKDQIKDNYLEDIIEKLLKIKKNSFFTCIKIDEITDKMFQKLKKSFPDIIITEKSQPNQLSDLVRFTLRTAIHQSKQLGQKVDANNQIIEATFIRTNYVIRADYDQNADTREFWKNFWKTLDDSNLVRSGKTSIDIETKHQAVSQDDISSTYIFKLFDPIQNKYMAAKIPKQYYEKYQQNNVTDEDKQIVENLAKARYQSTFYAYQLATLFRLKTKDYPDIPPIYYPFPSLYILDTPFFGLSVLYAETYLGFPHYEWKKFTTNQSSSSVEDYFFSVFSHFSFVETKGLLVIMDLQGVGNVLTDPSIQTIKGSIPILEFDPTNYQNEGLLIFKMNQHKECSILCNKLKLSRENFEDKQNKNNKFDQSQWNLEKVSQIYVICENCKELSSYSQDQYYQIKQNKIKCENCIQIQEDPHFIFCSCCKKKYQACANDEIISLTLLSICSICKIKCSFSQLEKCLYCNYSCQINLHSFLNDFICPLAKQYLRTLKCRVCNADYNFQTKLSQVDYENGNYLCQNHQNN